MVKKSNSNVVESSQADDQATIRLNLARYPKVTIRLQAHELKRLVTVANWRSPIQLAQRRVELASSLREQGQQTPIMARPLAFTLAKGEEFTADKLKGVDLGIIRGHSRKEGFEEILQVDGAKRFRELFPDGVEVDVYMVSAEEAAVLAMDNASSVNMENVYDWTMAACVLMAAGVKGADMMLALEKLTERLFPIKGDTDNGKAVLSLREEIKAIEAEISDLRSKLDALDPKAPGIAPTVDALETMIKSKAAEASAKAAKVNEIIADMRRGHRDRLQAHWNAGHLMDYWLHQTTLGVPHPECPENLKPIFEAVPYSVKGELPELARAAKEDAGAKGALLTPAQRERVITGPNWRKRFDRLVEKAKKKIADKAGKEPEARPKAKSGKEMKAIAEARVSDGLKEVFGVLTGTTKGLSSDEETRLFQRVDGLLKIAEVVSAHEPEFWRVEVVGRYNKLKAALKEQAESALTEAEEADKAEEAEEAEKTEKKRSRGRAARK